MYSWELEEHFKNCKYTFSNFYDFNKLVDSSPQVKYNLSKELKDTIILNVWSDDNYHWTININKEARIC
jgi:hypothetical protein